MEVIIITWKSELKYKNYTFYWLHLIQMNHVHLWLEKSKKLYLTCRVLEGMMPPPISNMPPAAVIPEMALVTDMRGEWRAGVTPQTVW